MDKEDLFADKGEWWGNGLPAEGGKKCFRCCWWWFASSFSK
jgi:hypothetical protein